MNTLPILGAFFFCGEMFIIDKNGGLKYNCFNEKNRLCFLGE